MKNNGKGFATSGHPKQTEYIFEHGKVQPQAVDLEEAVICAMMIEPDACAIGMTRIKSGNMFYKDQHKVIFEAMQSLYNKNAPVDMLTVTQELKALGTLEQAGGGYYITLISDKISSSANLEYHIAIINQKYLRREIIRLSSEAIRESFEDTEDVFDSIDKITIELIDLYNTINTSNTQHVGDIAAYNANIIKNLGKRELTGLVSGFKLVDMVTSGFQNGDLIIIAGRPGMGKTAFGVSMMFNMSINFNIPIGFISLEMTKSQVVMRLQSIMMNMRFPDLRNGNLNDDQKSLLDENVRKLKSVTAYIDDTPTMSIVQMRAKAMNMVKNHKVKMIMVDYLQLMTGVNKWNQNREQEVSTISRGLKALAKELNIPIIAFSQLSRKVEDRPGGDKRPKLSDLRESGAIEQDADLVMFLYRPEYYGIKEDAEGNSMENKGVVLIEKHRNGRTGEFKLTFNKELMYYENEDEEYKRGVSTIESIDFSESRKVDAPF